MKKISVAVGAFLLMGGLMGACHRANDKAQTTVGAEAGALVGSAWQGVENGDTLIVQFENEQDCNFLYRDNDIVSLQRFVYFYSGGEGLVLTYEAIDHTTPYFFADKKLCVVSDEGDTLMFDGEGRYFAVSSNRLEMTDEYGHTMSLTRL